MRMLLLASLWAQLAATPAAPAWANPASPARSAPPPVEVAGIRYAPVLALGGGNLKDNMPREAFSKSIPGTLRLAEIFAEKKRLAKGETFSVDFLPGQGTQVLVNGKPMGAPIAEPEFFNALMSIWLGPSPADAALKAALLGQAVPAAYSRER